MGQGLQFYTDATNESMNMNFYSSSLGTLSDAYITCQGGTSSATQGNMVIGSRNLTLQTSNNLIMGSTTNNTYIQNATSTVIGSNPTSYNATNGTVSGYAIIFKPELSDIILPELLIAVPA